MHQKIFVIPLARESIDLSKRVVTKGRVRLRKSVRTERATGTIPAMRQEVHIERVERDEVLAEPPAPRVEGDELVIPVVEEVLVLERRYRLREEIRVARTEHVEQAPYDELLRVEDIEIERIEEPEEAGPPRADVEDEIMAIGREEDKRLVVGYFDDEAKARNAMQALEASGITPQDIDMVEPKSDGGAEKHGIWEKIKETLGFGVSEQDRHSFDEGLKHGGILLDVRTPESKVDAVCRLLEQYDAADIDERMSEWGGTPTTTTMGTGTTGSGAPMGEWTGSQTARVGPPSAGAAEASAGPKEAGGVVIPVAEEEVRVGKREVKRGRVRVYQRVEVLPVEEAITLREEQVNVERVPADRPVSPTEPAFQERTYEVTETTEEPVVSKQARVVEEVVVSRDVAEHEEVIQDTARRTDVDVERVPAAAEAKLAGEPDEQAFRAHYTSTLAKGGQDYDRYRPAYRFGHELGKSTAPRLSWAEVERQAKPRWEERNPGTWAEVKDAVRHAFEGARRRMRGAA